MTVIPSERSCSTNTKTDQDFENPSRNKEIIADFGSQVSKNGEIFQNWFILQKGADLIYFEIVFSF